MPTEKRRVNLTIPEDVYQRLQVYKASNGILNDATACYQLIVQQLKSQEVNAAMLKVLQSLSNEQLAAMSQKGIELARLELGSHAADGGGLQGPATAENAGG